MSFYRSSHTVHACWISFHRSSYAIYACWMDFRRSSHTVHACWIAFHRSWKAVRDRIRASQEGNLTGGKDVQALPR